jgi:hypothetical protein
MNKALKITIIIATIGVIGTAGYFVYQAIKKGRNGEGDVDGDGGGDGGEKAPAVDPSSVGQGGGGNSLQKTPFTNKGQGDMFRIWVNNNYPEYAKTNDLSLSGDFDNSFMRKAWIEYGNKYKNINKYFLKYKANSVPNYMIKLLGSRKKEGDLINSEEGEIKLVTTEVVKRSPNNGIWAVFRGDGSVWFFSDNADKSIATGKWWDDGKQINVRKKNYKGTDFYNTAYKVAIDLPKGSASFDGNLQFDLDVPSRRGLDLDINIIG